MVDRGAPTGGHVETVVGTADGDDPLGLLAAAAERRREAERGQDAAVRRARVAGLSWAQIAEGLGVSKQAAHRKYRGRTLRRD